MLHGLHIGRAGTDTAGMSIVRTHLTTIADFQSGPLGADSRVPAEAGPNCVDTELGQLAGWLFQGAGGSQLACIGSRIVS